MDRFALAGSLRAANARVVAGQWALLEQRAQVRELEQCGLDASMAKALLEIYEEQQAMSVIDRNSLSHTLTRLAADRSAPVDYDDRGLFDADDDFHLKQAA
jgi:hypothetical protein